jgi:DNA-binding GntR family transcriptional regulator
VSIDREAETPPFAQLATILRKQIESGELRSGRALPSLTHLMQHYDLSRNTVRRAIGVLTEDGLVRTRPGWGTFVVPPNERPGTKARRQPK